MIKKPTYEKLEQRVKESESGSEQRKQANKNLSDSEKKSRYLLDLVPDPIAIIQNDKHVFINQKFTEFFKYTMQDVKKGLRIPDLVFGKDREIAASRIKDRFAGKKFESEYVIVDIMAKDGKVFTCDVIGNIIEYEGQPADLVILRDITERKKAEEHAIVLSRQLITSQENERQMISYELHDSVAQDLSAATITCGSLLKSKSITPEAKKKISSISETLRKVLKSVRNLSYELRPPGLGKIGLSHTMYQFCKDFSAKTGVKVDFKSVGINDLNLEYNMMINAYRLLQESLNNVRKHADATEVKVRLVSSFPNIILRVHDDGKGFDPEKRLDEASAEKRMGLSSMEGRVSLIGGKINIESVLGKGTRIIIEIPVENET